MSKESDFLITKILDKLNSREVLAKICYKGDVNITTQESLETMIKTASKDIVDLLHDLRSTAYREGADYVLARI